MNTLKTKIILLIVTILLSFPVLALAQENNSTSSATPEEIEQSLKARIQKALEENADSVANTINSSRTKALIGIVEEISQNNIDIIINPGTSKEYQAQVSLAESTIITRVGKGQIKPDSVQIGDYIIAIGTFTSDTAISATDITLDKATTPKFARTIVYTTITDVDTDENTLTLKNGHPALNDPISITKNTDIFSSKSHETLDIDDVAIGQKAVAILFTNTSKETTSLGYLTLFPLSEDAQASDSPTPSTTQTTGSCGDGICQNVVCLGEGCPDPETPETCPADCTD